MAAPAPVTGLTQQTNFFEWTGSKYNVRLVIVWNESEPGPCHYVVDVHQVVAGGWQTVASIDKGVGFANIQIGAHGPSDNWQYHRFYDQIRVTTVKDPDDGTYGVTGPVDIVWYYNRFRNYLYQAVLHNGGWVGNQLFLWFNGIDPSYHIYCANVQVYNMSANNRLIMHRSLQEGDPALAANYCDHSRPSIGFYLSGADIPNQGDRIQVHYTAVVGDGKVPSALSSANDGIETIWTTTFTQPVWFPFISLSGTQGNGFYYSIQNAPGITGDQWHATFSVTSGSLPPGLNMDSTGAITGTPTTLGTYGFHVQTISGMGDIGGGDVQIIISVSQLPLIISATDVSYYQYASFIYQLLATNHPSSFAIASGSLPAGLALNTTTGAVTGAATALGNFPVGFTATNVTGTGPQVTVTIHIVALPLPTVTSPSTATAYRGETWNYTITATNSPVAYSAGNLPTAAALTVATGRITGVIDPATNIPATTRDITLRAQNQTGYSPVFHLTLTIADRLPVITSDLTVTTTAFTSFTYQITATSFPVTFGAAGLPIGLQVDPNSGLITGTPVTPGTVNITLNATNTAGTGTATLVLIIKLERPVIDISITSGKAITCETGTPVEFQPVATNLPTSWTCVPVPEGFILNSDIGLLTGTFSTVGLYGTVFEASNAAGESDPAIFYFLVEQGAGGTVSAIGSGLDIWIDIQSGEVTLLSPGQTMDVTTTTTKDGTTTTTTGKAPVPVSDAVIVNKRGDTLPITIWFHKGGKPVKITDLTSLMYGVREDYTSPYAVLTTGYLANDDGSYTIWPDYSGNAEIDFEIDDEEEFLELLAEVQWETGTEDPMDDRIFTRRSSQTFKNQIYRDVINPDDPNLQQ